MHTDLLATNSALYPLHCTTISLLWNLFRQHNLVEKLQTLNFRFGSAIK